MNRIESDALQQKIEVMIADMNETETLPASGRSGWGRGHLHQLRQTFSDCAKSGCPLVYLAELSFPGHVVASVLTGRE